MVSEHRHAPRYPFMAEAEITEIATDTTLAARTSDLSLTGCFLDMLNTSPEGTDIRIKISHEDTTFTAIGKVAFVLPNMGMGVTFTNVQDDQMALLQKWIAALS